VIPNSWSFACCFIAMSLSPPTVSAMLGVGCDVYFKVLFNARQSITTLQCLFLQRTIRVGLSRLGNKVNGCTGSTLPSLLCGRARPLSAGGCAASLCCAETGASTSSMARAACSVSRSAHLRAGVGPLAPQTSPGALAEAAPCLLVPFVGVMVASSKPPRLGRTR
jgi:hypothetical protein